MLPEINSVNGVSLAIGGPSGSGKSTVIDGLKKYFGPKVFGSVTYTTRAQRQGEISGTHYHFVNISQLPIFREDSRYIGFVEARGNWYWIDSCELIAQSHRNPSGLYLTAITQVHEFIERRDIIPNLHWIWLTATNKELHSRLIKRGDGDIESSRKHNELLEKQDRSKLVSLEIDTENHNPEEVLRLIINFIEKLEERKS